MKRFKNILLFAGGDVPPTLAIERGAALAQANRARLSLVDVLPGQLAGAWTTGPDSKDPGQMLSAARLEDLNELAAPIRERGIEVETRVLTGRPFVELIREVQRREHDLVMKTAQGPGGQLGGLLGSTALHLFRKCPCPVWVVKPDDADRGRVLAAIDPQAEEDDQRRLSKTVLELASSMARVRGAELDIVHAWWLWSESMLRSPRFDISAEAVDAMVEKTGREAEAAIREMVDKVDLSGVTHRMHVVRGQPFEVISDFTTRVDIAVLGTLSRSGIAGVLIGNTAERVLRNVDCSVIAVKPHGFESPIRLPDENPQTTAGSD